MKRSVFSIIALSTILLTSLAGCRGGLCNACGGGAAPTGYNYQQAGCNCGPGGFQGGVSAPAGTFVNPGGFGQQQPFIQTQQPGVISPQQVIPNQTQPNQIFGSGTR